MEEALKGNARVTTEITVITSDKINSVEEKGDSFRAAESYGLPHSHIHHGQNLAANSGRAV
jgi:hypothetical protein